MSYRKRIVKETNSNNETKEQDNIVTINGQSAERSSSYEFELPSGPKETLGD